MDDDERSLVRGVAQAVVLVVLLGLVGTGVLSYVAALIAAGALGLVGALVEMALGRRR